MSPFEPYMGKKINNQDTLSQRFISLHAEDPICNDIQSGLESDVTAIFDGQYWRELDLDAINKGNDRR